METANAKSVAYLGTIEDSLASIVVHLSQSAIDDSQNELLLSAITEATFDGYQTATLAFEACDVTDDSYAEIASQAATFEAGDNVVTQVIYFAYITHTPVGGSPKILGVYEFPEPVIVDTPGQEVTSGAWRLSYFE